MLTLRGGASLVGGTLDNSGTLEIASSSGATLDGVTIAGSGSIEVDVATAQATPTLVLDHSTAITHGSLTVGPFGTLAIETAGGATLHGVNVTNNNSIEVFAGSVLILDQVTTVDNSTGAIAIDGTGMLTLEDASISGGTVNNYSIVSGSIVAGDIDVTGSSTISGASLNNGDVTIGSSATLTLDNVTVTDALFADTADGAIIQVDGATTLTLDGVTVDGGAITDNGTVNVDATKIFKLNGVALSGGAITNAGTIEITGSSSIENDTLGNTQLTVDSGQTLTLDGSTVTGGTITNTGATLKVDADTTLTLQGGVTVVGGTLDDSGTVKIEGTSGATLDGVTVTGSGAIQVDGAASPASTLILEDGTVITGGTLTMGPAGTLAIETAGGATLSDVDVTNGYSIEVFAGSVLILDQLTSVANAGAIMTIDGTGKLTLNDASITGGTINNYSSVTSGSIVAGDIDITGSSSISDASLNNGQVTIESNQILTLDDDTVIGTTFIDTADGAVIQIDSDTTLDGVTVNGGAITDSGTVNVDATKTLKLNGVALSGGAITNAGSIEIVTSSSIENDTFGNAQLTVDSGQTLTLDGTTITGGTVTNTGATLKVDTDTTLTLQGGVTVVGGTLDDSGTVQIEGASGATLDGVNVTGAGAIQVDGAKSPASTLVLEDGTVITGGTLTMGPAGTLAVETAGGAALHDVDITNGYSIEVFAGSVLILDQLTSVANAGATMTIDGTGTLTLNDASITGGTINDYSSLTSGSIVAGDIDITGSSSIIGASLNNGQVTIESNQTLTLDNDTVTGTSFADTADGAIIQIDGGTTLKLDGVSITGGTINDYSLVSGSIVAGDIDVTGSSKISGAGLNHGDVTIGSGATLTLDNDTVTGTSFTDTADGAIIQIDGGTTLTLAGVSITGGTINDYSAASSPPGSIIAGDIDVTGASTISGAQLNNGQVTIESNVALTLDNDTVTGTHFSDIADGATIQIDGGTTLTLDGVTINGGIINDFSPLSPPSESIVAGNIDITGSSIISNAHLNNGHVTIESGRADAG
jgi:fibronectin-binding autotransporter adhesin